jgi:hypothetical protein
MEGTADAFFFQAGAFGLSDVVLTLVEQPHLDWDGRGEYLRARLEKRAVDLYASDMIWMLAKAYLMRHGCDFDVPSPSSREYKKEEKDSRSAQEIKDQLLKKLEGS